MNQRGFIEVNEQLQTAEPSIYAIGDVVGEPMLAHKASHEGRVAVEAIAGEKVAFEPLAIPAVVFTDPELAWCGLTESDAQKQGRKVTVARFPWAASGRALTLDRPDGMTKLIVDPDDRAHPRRRHRRTRRRRADRRRRAGGRDGRERDRPEDVDPPAPDAVRDADGVGRGVLRPRHARLSAETVEISSSDRFSGLTASRHLSPLVWTFCTMTSAAVPLAIDSRAIRPPRPSLFRNGASSSPPARCRRRASAGPWVPAVPQVF